MLVHEKKGSLISKNANRSVVLFSGGIDSTATAVTLLQRGEKPILLFIKTGAPDIEISLDISKKIAKRLDLELIVNNSLEVYGSKTTIGEELYIPRRNVFFCLIAATYGNRVYLGGIKGDFTNDKSPLVLRLIKEVVNATGNSNEQVEFMDSILWEKDKIEIGRLVLNAGYKDVLVLALSCYSGQQGHCGDCQACMRKYVMLTELGVPTKNIFAKNPISNIGAQYYRELCESGTYFENIPENAMRRALGLKQVNGGNAVRTFDDKEAIIGQLKQK